MICYRCCGTTRYLGNGMIETDCTICVDGKIVEKKPKPIEDHKIDRKSKSYKTAIKDIMELNPDISKEDAVKMFDDAYDKV